MLTILYFCDLTQNTRIVGFNDTQSSYTKINYKKMNKKWIIDIHV